VWNTHLKKRWSLKDANSNGDHELSSSITSSSSSSSTSFTSCGKQNNIGVDHEKLVDHHQDSQKEVGDELFITAKDPRQQQQQQTSCSVSDSYDSNVSNSRSAVEVSRPEDQMDSLIHYGGPYDVNHMLQEVNKPEGLEIPLEADVDFWNMLDNLDSVLSTSEAQFGHDHQVVNGCKISNSVEVENKRWLCYLENELGLDAMGEEDVAPENFQCQIFSNPDDQSDPEINGLFSN
jgi:myb proto-oncogene protein